MVCSPLPVRHHRNDHYCYYYVRIKFWVHFRLFDAIAISCQKKIRGIAVCAGVENAFSTTPHVMTVSFHKYDTGFFPGN